MCVHLLYIVQWVQLCVPHIGMLYLIVTVSAMCSCYGNSVARATVIVLQQIVLSVCVDLECL